MSINPVRAIGGMRQPARSGDVGHDLPAVIVRQDTNFFEKLVWALSKSDGWLRIVWPKTSKIFRTDVRLALPQDKWVQVQHRSSIFKRGLMVVSSPIDSGYRGPIFAKLYNFGWLPRIVRNGDRIAQIVFFPAVRPNIHFVEEFHDTTDRGGAGFGSTGR